MMPAPLARTSSGRIALTVAAVPTGMKAGVRISPRCIAITPVRAAPSVAETENEKRGTRRASDGMGMIEHHRRNGRSVVGHAVTAPYVHTGRDDRALGRFID